MVMEAGERTFSPTALVRRVVGVAARGCRRQSVCSALWARRRILPRSRVSDGRACGRCSRWRDHLGGHGPMRSWVGDRGRIDRAPEGGEHSVGGVAVSPVHTGSGRSADLHGASRGATDPGGRAPNRRPRRAVVVDDHAARRRMERSVPNPAAADRSCRGHRDVLRPYRARQRHRPRVGAAGAVDDRRDHLRSPHPQLGSGGGRGHPVHRHRGLAAAVRAPRPTGPRARRPSCRASAGGDDRAGSRCRRTRPATPAGASRCHQQRRPGVVGARPATAGPAAARRPGRRCGYDRASSAPFHRHHGLFAATGAGSCRRGGLLGRRRTDGTALHPRCGRRPRGVPNRFGPPYGSGRGVARCCSPRARACFCCVPAPNR